MYQPGNGMLDRVYIYNAIYPWVYQGKRLTGPTLMHTTKLMNFFSFWGKPRKKKINIRVGILKKKQKIK
jgi:hypothetical protein